MIGQVVGTYKIVEKLGEGGMGFVYKGIDVMVERPVAMKVLRPEIASQPEILERFRTEAVTLAKLNHPSIATLYSFFPHGQQYFMVMEFVPGRTLDRILREGGPMPAQRAIPIFLNVLDGIDHAHRLGILHRDIKPANIMLTAEDTVKVTDFGIARVLGTQRMTREGSFLGTLEYIAPERIKGQEANLSSDIYSLGAVLFEMLTGHMPFELENEYALMRAHLEEAPPPLARHGVRAGPAIEAAIARALAKDPKERFQTALEFGQALEQEPAVAALKATRLAAVHQPPAKPTRLAASEPAKAAPAAATKKKTNWKIYAAALSAVVLIAVVASVLYLTGVLGGKPPATAGPNRPAPAAVQPAPADAGIPQPGSLPAGLSRGGAREILKGSVPLPGPPASVPQKPAEAAKPEEKKSPPAMTDEERRRAALAALEQDSGAPKKTPEQSERERKRAEALKALEK